MLYSILRKLFSQSFRPDNLLCQPIVPALRLVGRRAVLTGWRSGYPCAAMLLLLLVMACQPEPPRTAKQSPAFYHWKATFDPTPGERQLLDSLGVQTMYLRLFDVDWQPASQMAVPKATLLFRQRPNPARRVVPVVYITNRAVASLRGVAIADLTRNLTRRVTQLMAGQRLRFDELQLDCDWTQSTRRTYFALLRAIARQAKVPLSATIRLHQVKFAGQTGVPPVTRGMLMAYNTGDWKMPTTHNSILDLQDLRNYTGYLPGYPLPLDLALPLFRWTVIYRNGRFLTLLNNVGQAQLRAVPALQVQTDSTRFMAVRDTTWRNLSLRRGDLLRAEACPLPTLTAARDQLLAQLPDQPRTFTLYHLDSTVLHAYPNADLQTLLPRP